MGMKNELTSKEKSYLILKETLRFIRFVLILAIVFWLIRSFVMQPFIVRGSSMEHTFSNGDYVIIEKLSYRMGEPQRGDIVIFNAGFTSSAPDDQSFFIKRVVGLPGETVRVQNNKVIIRNSSHPNGRILREPYLDEGVRTKPREYNRVTLASDEYFVMGDNRPNSSDSRVWGALNEKKIVGKPLVRAYPFDDFQIFTRSAFERNIDT
ncbi:MAG: signal peptidase I [Parcubacteria group bacterium SW_4_49_11]|nr:MAG: signal peptidase I [Parcubacteria group bacterium SW_4_49_11]